MPICSTSWIRGGDWGDGTNDYFRRMRNTAVKISEQYINSERRLGHPFMKVWPQIEAAEETLTIQLARTEYLAFLLAGW
ncbi:MAG: hypothetical protein H6669_13200 [Ardenticatenaceae bacterium]|nr:hypothetical protein [Ardenticatenaceae bacterium]